MTDRSPRPPLLRRLLLALASTLVALVLAELIATWALDNAYPYLNLFVADARLGVRLAPNAATTVRSPLGRLTDIETNAEGFRGPRFGAGAGPGAAAGSVLIVGDSQVLAYGVAEADGFPARLERAGLVVMAAGIPTWGPREYALIVEELVAAHDPAVVVVVINAANDFNEAPVPNTQRTTARDGWAVGLVPGLVLEPPTDFPLRHFLLSRSHLVLALRLMLHGDPHAREVPPIQSALAFAAERPVVAPPFRNPIGEHLAAMHRTCLLRGCRVLPVFLPADVEVDAREWAKYQPAIPAPLPLAPLRALADTLRVDAMTLSLKDARVRSETPPRSAVLDLGPALAAASPGAFLPDDFHLSARGHAAIAEHLQQELARLLSQPRPRPLADTEESL